MTGVWQRVSASWEEIGGEVVVFHARALHRLAGPVALVWQISDEPALEADLIAVMTKFGLDRVAAAEAIASLHASDLLRPA